MEAQPGGSPGWHMTSVGEKICEGMRVLTADEVKGVWRCTEGEGSGCVALAIDEERMEQKRCVGRWELDRSGVRERQATGARKAELTAAGQSYWVTCTEGAGSCSGGD